MEESNTDLINRLRFFPETIKVQDHSSLVCTFIKRKCLDGIEFFYRYHKIIFDDKIRRQIFRCNDKKIIKYFIANGFEVSYESIVVYFRFPHYNYNFTFVRILLEIPQYYDLFKDILDTESNSHMSIDTFLEIFDDPLTDMFERLELARCLYNKNIFCGFNTFIMRYIAFKNRFEEKRQIKAKNKIQNWWIEIVYDVDRECGQRMMMRNYEKYLELIDQHLNIIS